MILTMILFKKFFHYVVLFSALIFVPFVFADDFDISQYASQNDITNAAENLVTDFTKEVPEFKYLKLEDPVAGVTGSVKIIDNNLLTSIKINSIILDLSGVPLFSTYSPTISMSADINSDCVISNEQYTVQRTNLALDTNFKNDLDAYGHFMFETLINKMLINRRELLNRCHTPNDVNIANVVSTQEIQTAAQAFADELKMSHLNLDNMVIEKINSYTGYAKIENNILNHIRINSFKLDLSGFPTYNLYSPTIDIDADIAPDCSISKHTFIVEESNPGLDNFFHMNLFNHGDTFIKTLIQSSLLKNYCSAN